MSEIRSQATPARDLETQLRDAVLKTFYDIASSDPRQKRGLAQARINNPKKLAEMDRIISDAFLASILPIITKHLEENQP